jgi:hypothetical protein
MGKNLSSKCKEYKEILLAIIEELHLKAEVQPLTASEEDVVLGENELVTKLRRDEDFKWAQWAKIKRVQERGMTTNIFI